MVQFKVGEIVTLCAVIHDFCGIDNLYFIGDINSTIGTCTINTDTSTCLDLSNVQLEFQWGNSTQTNLNNNCDPSAKLKTLGIAYTDTQGVASINYTILQEDLDFYNTNLFFDLRVCIINKIDTEVVNFGEIRDNFHPGDKITIVEEIFTPVLYDLTIKLSTLTLSSYVINTIDNFTEILNEWIITKISNVKINSVTYDEPNHEIIVEIEEIPQLSYLTNHSIKTLIAPLIAAKIILIIAAIAMVAIGWIGSYLHYGKKEIIKTHSKLQIQSFVLTNDLSANPIEDVIVEIGGETLTADKLNNYTVTTADLEIGKTYPLKIYIPLSAGSSVYKALYENNVMIEDLPLNFHTAKLKINTLAERDYRPCNLILDNGNPPPLGTILRIFKVKILDDSEIVLEQIGITTIGSDRCAVDTMKVPAYLTDNMIKRQYSSNSIDPDQPSPTLVPGDQDIIPTVGNEKNTIGVIVQTTLKNNITPDKIDIIDSNDVIIKSIIPTKYTTLITGIPIGTFTISVTKSGYKYSSCSLSPCEVTFTTDYLGGKTVTIIMESLVTTCKLNIYVTDKYNKPPKSATYISIDEKTEQLAPNGNLQISEITKGNHKFSVRAEGYKKITENRDITCVIPSDVITFKLDQIDEIPVPEHISLTVNDQRSSVVVNKSDTITIKAIGQDPTEDVEIYNISEFPDLLVATIQIGQTETTLTVPNKDTTFELQAFQKCIIDICAKSSNIISLTVGVGEEGCVVPGPFGTCLLRESTGKSIATIAGLAIGGIILIKLLPGLIKDTTK